MAMIGVDCGSWRVLLDPSIIPARQSLWCVISPSTSPREVPGRCRSKLNPRSGLPMEIDYEPNKIG